jgi:hypothetical protein
MVPFLQPGQGVIAIRWPHRRAGQVRVVRHPADHTMWIVKRLDRAVDAERWHVLADNRTEGIDSEQFGPVDLSDSWLVVVAIPLRLM